MSADIQAPQGGLIGRIMQIAGPALWAELHMAASLVTLDALPAWLVTFAARIPCGDCRRHFEGFTREIPPDFTSAAAFFAWTVAIHNRVNERLNRPLMEIQTAAARWEFIAPAV